LSQIPHHHTTKRGRRGFRAAFNEARSKGGIIHEWCSAEKTLFPGLAGFYASFRDIAYTLVRVIIGYILLMHGWGKFNSGLGSVVGLMDKVGLSPGIFLVGRRCSWRLWARFASPSV
jgi:hypothetical protein